MPPPAPLEAAVEARVALEPATGSDQYSVARERVGYQVEPGERVGAYLFVPFPARHPARPRGRPSSCLHQHAGQFELGKSEPAGLAGNPEQHYALELARRGYVALVADHLCFEERRDPARTRARPTSGSNSPGASRLGSSLQTKYSSDAHARARLPGAREEVDPARLGCIGHSLGGQQALFLAALDERVAAASRAAALPRWRRLPRPGSTTTSPPTCRAWRPRATSATSWRWSRRGRFVGVGPTDRIFPVDGVEATVAAARAAYAAADAASRLALMIEPGGHAFYRPDAGGGLRVPRPLAPARLIPRRQAEMAESARPDPDQRDRLLRDPGWFWTALDTIKAGEYGQTDVARDCSTTPSSSRSATRSAPAST